MGPGIEVGQVLVVCEGFPLKADMSVSLIMIPVLHPPNQVFDDIPEVKRKNPQFKLLPEVNTFVVEQGRAGVPMPDKNKGEQRHAIRPQRSNMNNEHRANRTHKGITGISQKLLTCHQN